MRPSEGPLAYPESSHSASAVQPARSKAAVVNVPATQSAVPLCSRSQTVIAASTAGSGCAQVILAKRGRQPASGAGLIKATAVTFVSTCAVAGRYTIGSEGERFIASI
jgi:hypothetical protein